MAELPRGATLIDDLPVETGSGPLVITVAPNRRQRDIPAPPEGFTPTNAPAPAPSTWDSVKTTLADVGQALPTGIIKGAIGIAGLPGVAADWLGKGADGVAEYLTGEPVAQKIRENTPAQSVSPARLTQYFENLTGKLYEPQTTAGKYAQTVGEFIPGAGRSLANQLRYAVAPGIATERAGQATEGTPLEPFARAGAAVATGGLAALTTRPATATTLSAHLRGVDEATLVAAEQLMQAAQARGIALAWPEAIAHVSNGGSRGLVNLQRFTEDSVGGGDIMGNFMAQRPGQVEAAGRQTFDALAPQSQAPATLGPTIGRAADDTIKEATGIIDRATSPAYQAAKAQRVGPQVHDVLMSDPLYAQVFQEVRGTPALNRTIATLPDDAVGVIDVVQRRMGEHAAVPGQASARNMTASAHSDARTVPIAAADRATGSRAATATQPAQIGSYEAARAQQEALRQHYLEPLMAGPLGKIAKRDIETREAIEVLFPTDPVAVSAREITDTIGALTRRSPMAARQLVRARVESLFNSATRTIQAKPNQFGGADFVSALKGNSQQAENLAAAIQGVGGPELLQGFDEFLNILSATGQRLHPGSQAPFNKQAEDALKGGGGGMAADTAGMLVEGRIKWPKKATETYERWQLGQNTEEIARLITDPAGIETFRRLAKAAPGSSQAQALAIRLAAMTAQAIAAAQPRK
ncbi:hypothetical protein SAMN05216304_109135 [Bosea sp. OK403]|uniref:hypothetical protein n=1 Tax=Bosea sp. OK403 TaxID=1855286 RepID=UPI0008E0FBD3|nr:hypothetical protein [Bosea sp. OK403]SFJ54715.1 hypothetical protein SAMN05216304_109135 [Bosea sp. OK403]